MDALSWRQLWEDQELRSYIKQKIRLSRIRDRGNAEGEAYAWLCRLPPGLGFEELCGVVDKAVASCERAERRQMGLPPLH